MENTRLMGLVLVASLVVNALLAAFFIVALVLLLNNRTTLEVVDVEEAVQEPEVKVEEDEEAVVAVETEETVTPTAPTAPSTKTYSDAKFSVTYPTSWFVTSYYVASYDLDGSTTGSGGFVDPSKKIKCDIMDGHGESNLYAVTDTVILSSNVTREYRASIEPGPGGDGNWFYKVTNGAGKKLGLGCYGTYGLSTLDSIAKGITLK